MVIDDDVSMLAVGSHELKQKQVTAQLSCNIAEAKLNEYLNHLNTLNAKKGKPSDIYK